MITKDIWASNSENAHSSLFQNPVQIVKAEPKNNPKSSELVLNYL